MPTFKITAYKWADSLRSLYILSCEPCHLVDNCVQYQCNVLYILRLVYIFLLDFLPKFVDQVITSVVYKTY